MTPYERLMAESFPTGRFGRPDPRQPVKKPTPPSTPRQQAARRAALEREQHRRLLPDARSQRNRERKRARPNP